MKTSLLCRSIVLVLGLSLAACSSDDSSVASRDSGRGDSASGGSAGSSTGGTSAGTGGDPHHGSGGTSGATGSGGMGGMMMDGGMGGMMMDGGMGGMMMDGSMMDGASGMHAPMIQSVTPMSGGLHVMWMNVTTDCEKIELLRNKDGGAYSVAYTLTGSATSQHDTQITSPGTYCYKARCVKGSQTSAESTEKCGSP